MLSVSSRELILFQSLQLGSLGSEGDSQLLLFTLAGRGSNESGWFQGLPGAVLSCLSSCLRSFLACFNLRGGNCFMRPALKGRESGSLERGRAKSGLADGRGWVETLRTIFVCAKPEFLC